jgi:hypothetical protein
LDSDPPPWVWRSIGLAAVTVLLLTVTVIGLISAGVFDPKPLGEPYQTDVPGLVSVPAGQSLLAWQEGVLPRAPFSLRLEASYVSGEADSGFGLAVGNDSNHMIIAVSPVGYVTIQQHTGSGSDPILPWQTWPHVGRNDRSNEIQLDIQGDQATVRINREWLWQGPWSAPADQVGTWVESYGGDVDVDFRALTRFRETKK